MKPRGFTLVEVLIALVLMAVMSAMAWRGLDAMLRSREVTQASIDRSSVLQTALAQWEQDLSQIQDSRIVPPLAFDGARLRMTRRQPQGLQVVVWFVADGQWSRWASAPVTGLADLRRTWERSDQPLTLEAQRLPVLSGIQGWQLFYFWDNAWANALSTGGEARPPPKPSNPAPPGDAASNPPGGQVPPSQIPDGIRLQLEFGPGSGYSGTLMRQISLPSGT